jgi:gliding motility-associated-like protein
VIGVDNAYYASADIRNCIGGPCIDYYSPLNCFDLLVEDTVVCFNQEITIDLDRGGDSINWYSSRRGFIAKAPVLQLRVTEPDTIFAIHIPRVPCQEISDACVLNYSLSIGIDIRQEELLQDIELCPGLESTVEVAGKWDSLVWWYRDSQIAKSKSITLDSVPEFPLVVEGFDSLECAAYDTLTIAVKSDNFSADLVSSTIRACAGKELQLNVFSEINTEKFQFSWMPAELFNEPVLASPTLVISEVIPVSVIVTEDRCFIDTVLFELVLDPEPVVETNGNQEIYLGEKVLLKAEGAKQYDWEPSADLESPNSQITWARPLKDTRFTVIGEDENGCTAESTLMINVQNSVFIPELFTPNGDGNNDFLQVYGENIFELSFQVYDERGALMAELSETNNRDGWDGTVGGKELPSGTYFWSVSGQFADGKPISYQGSNKGTVRLVR